MHHTYTLCSLAQNKKLVVIYLEIMKYKLLCSHFYQYAPNFYTNFFHNSEKSLEKKTLLIHSVLNPEHEQVEGRAPCIANTSQFHQKKKNFLGINQIQLVDNASDS